MFAVILDAIGKCEDANMPQSPDVYKVKYKTQTNRTVFLRIKYYYRQLMKTTARYISTDPQTTPKVNQKLFF